LVPLIVTCFQVVTRRAQRSLALKEARLHIVSGFLSAVHDLDNIVKAIRSASDGKAAKKALEVSWQLSDEQAEAVLNMSLRRLTGLAIGELRTEHSSLQRDVHELRALLKDQVGA
jgi:DNA gyrase subunit A